MKFKISRVEPIRWPNKCIWCGDKPILEYPSGYRIPPEQMSIEYPVCKRHYFWSLGMDLLHFVVFWGMGLLLMGYVTAFFFGFFSIEMLLLLPLFAVLIMVIVLQPLRVRGARKNFYTLIIRNDDYGREFGMLNNLSPV
jgi:hypothetical protein